MPRSETVLSSVRDADKAGAVVLTRSWHRQNTTLPHRGRGEANSDKGLMSFSFSVGSALTGHRKGDGWGLERLAE